MLRALRRRLALLLALLSALVLTLVAAAGLWLSWQQQTRAADLVFRSRFAALCDSWPWPTWSPTAGWPPGSWSWAGCWT